MRRGWIDFQSRPVSVKRKSVKKRRCESKSNRTRGGRAQQLPRPDIRSPATSKAVFRRPIRMQRISNGIQKMTPTDALMQQAQTRPKSAVFIFHEEVWTYEKPVAEADRLAGGLAARGVAPGDRVALHMMDRPEMVAAYYACFKLGAIVAPLRTVFKFDELAPILQRLKPALYIGELSLYDNVAPVDASILAPDKRFIVNGTVEERSAQPWETLFDEATDAN